MLKSPHPLFVLTLCLTYPLAGHANDSAPVKVIEPKHKVAHAKSAKIDTERFQLGVFAGVLAAEDFNNNLSYGLSLNYKISSKYIAQINYGTSSVAKANYDTDRGFLTDSEREFNYYNIAAGYQLFSARTFIGAKRKYDTDIYLLAGVGSTEFARESNTSYMIGASYRVVFTDWLVWNLDIRDHLFNRAFFDDKKMTQNIEVVTGLNLLF